MPTNFPGGLDAWGDPGPDTAMNDARFDHDVQHANANDAIEAIEAALGINLGNVGAGAAVAAETTRATTVEGLLASKASPALTGTPTAPTASPLTLGTSIAFDTAQYPGFVTATSYTWSHTTSGTNRCLFVGLMCGGNNITGVTYGGVAMTALNAPFQVPGQRWATLWYLANPAGGANNVVATSSTSMLIVGTSGSYNGVDQSFVPVVATTTATATTSVTASVTTTSSNDWVIGFFANSGGNESAGTGTTARTATNSLMLVDNNGPVASGTVVSLQTTFGSAANWSAIVATIQPLASTQLATVAYSDAAITAAKVLLAPLASPALTGAPTAPTVLANSDVAYDALLGSLGPVAWWKLTEAAGATLALDASKLGNTGTVAGGVTFGSVAGPVAGQTAPLFDGASGTIKTTFGIPSIGTTATALLWVYPTTAGSLRTILSNGNSGATGADFELYHSSASPAIFESTGRAPVTDLTAGSLPLNAWSLVAVTFDGTNQKNYVNVATPVGTLARTATLATSQPFWLGQRAFSPTASFKGYMSQVAIFNYALTGAQIASLYAAASSGAAPIASTQYVDTAVSTTVLNKYRISGLGTTWSGSGTAAASVVTTSVAHDFSVGQGVQVWGAGAAPSGTYTPAAPTVTAVGTNGATVTYGYTVASIGNSTTVNGVSAAPTATTFSGNATLSATNYNKISWTPTFTPTAGQYDGYAVYGRVAGTLQLLGTTWVVPPSSFGATLVLAAAVPPYLGTHLVASTLYTYAITGVGFAGNETPVLLSSAVTTGATPYGVNLSWAFTNAPMMPYRYYNIYRNSGFMAQAPIGDCVWQDNGIITPGAAPPTTLSFVDTGFALPNAAPGVGVAPNVPALAPATAIGASLVTTVAAVTATTFTTAAAFGSTFAAATVTHDDTAALNTAIAAQGILSVPPKSRFFISGAGANIPAGAGLIGPDGPWVVGMVVTGTSNPVSTTDMAILCFTSYSSPGVTLGAGAGVQGVQEFWPYQTNGVYAGPSTNAHTPYPPGIFANGALTKCRKIVDCNSWVAMFLTGGLNFVDEILTSTLRYCVLFQAGEPGITNIRGDRASTYSRTMNMPSAADASAVRGFALSNLPTISNIGCDALCEVWYTTNGNAPGGAQGAIISDVWDDDSAISMVLDAPLSEPYVLGGEVFQHRLSNIYCMAGSGSVIITSGTSRPSAPGASLVEVAMSNVHFTAGLQLNGQINVKIVNGMIPVITCAASSLVDSPPVITLSLTNTFAPITVTSGAVKARVSTPSNRYPGSATPNTVTSGSLYVIDEQAMHTSRFRIPAGTVITTGSNVVGNILLPQAGSANSLYVVSAVGNGSSATDQWKLNAAALFTTSVSTGGLFVGAVGEGHGYSPTSAYTFANPGGAVGNFSVLPVTLNAAAGLTTAVAMDIEIVWCLTPLSA